MIQWGCALMVPLWRILDNRSRARYCNTQENDLTKDNSAGQLLAFGWLFQGFYRTHIELAKPANGSSLFDLYQDTYCTVDTVIVMDHHGSFRQWINPKPPGLAKWTLDMAGACILTASILIRGSVSSQVTFRCGYKHDILILFHLSQCTLDQRRVWTKCRYLDQIVSQLLISMKAE